jgi:hypothetical protein
MYVPYSTVLITIVVDTATDDVKIKKKSKQKMSERPTTTHQKQSDRVSSASGCWRAVVERHTQNRQQSMILPLFFNFLVIKIKSILEY